MIATLDNGEPIPCIQECIVDAGLCDFVVISMNNDMVFLRCMIKENVLHVFNEPIDFFGTLFEACVSGIQICVVMSEGLGFVYIVY